MNKAISDDKKNILKEKIMAIGHILWQKDLASGLNGNISVRFEDSLLLTGHGTCLGLLQKEDILNVTTNGEMLEDGQVSTEKLLHTEIYKNFPEVNAVIHTHTTYTNAFFLENETFNPRIFEAKFYLGEVKSIKQNTPSVTDTLPIIEALKQNNIVVLGNHGVVTMGEELFDCFLLIQALEEAIKTEAMSRLFTARKNEIFDGKVGTYGDTSLQTRKYKLFSQEQIEEIIRLVNSDKQLSDLGEKANMTMDLAVKLNETGTTYSFRFEKGKIVKLGNDENVEFLITAPENIWRAVFNREIDPFVATTQKKMNLRGDFARISKFYAPCSRLFELWQSVPVE